MKWTTFQPAALAIRRPIPGMPTMGCGRRLRLYRGGSARTPVSNVSDPPNQASIAPASIPTHSIEVRVYGNLAYLADGEAGMK